VRLETASEFCYGVLAGFRDYFYADNAAEVHRGNYTPKRNVAQGKMVCGLAGGALMFFIQSCKNNSR